MEIVEVKLNKSELLEWLKKQPSSPELDDLIKETKQLMKIPLKIGYGRDN